MPKHAATRAPKPALTHKARHTINRAPSPRWLADWREKVKTSALLNRLQSFALADPDDPTSPRMTRTQAQVALSLLRKVMPDMQSLELRGNTDQPITVSVLRFSDPVALPTATTLPDAPAYTNGALNGPTRMDDTALQPLTIDVQARLIEDEPASNSPPRTRARKQDQ